jgi:hypothetical protein
MSENRIDVIFGARMAGRPTARGRRCGCWGHTHLTAIS